MSKMNKVLVTGANGLLGANIVESLLAFNYRVVALVRKGANLQGLNDLDCDMFYGDISNKKDLIEAIKGCDIVIHSAAKTQSNINTLDAFYPINVEVTKNLIDISKASGVKRFLFIGTANTMTNGTIEKPGNESTSFMPWLYKSGYAYSKYLAQEYVLSQNEDGIFETMVLSPTFMIGPRDANHSSGQLLLFALKNKVIFCPPGGKSFVDVQNVAHAVVNAITKGKPKNVYLLSGENLTFKQFFDKVRYQIPQSKIVVSIPKSLLILGSRVVELSNKFLSTSFPFDRVTQRLFCLDNYFDNQKARYELGMHQTDTSKSIRKANKWFSENQHI